MLKALPSLRIAGLDALHRIYRSGTLARHLLGRLAMSLLLAPTLAVAADFGELVDDLATVSPYTFVDDGVLSEIGQGFSSRLADDNIGYVDDFGNYVTDLSALVSKVQQQRPSGSKPLFLLAHSMGGAIAALYLGSGQPTPFAPAPFVTPMMEPWANGDPSLGFEVPFLSPTIVYGQADFDAMEKAGRANTGLNGLTQSSSRYRHNWGARAGRCEPMQSAHCGSPTAKVSGSSLRWFLQAGKASLSGRTQVAKEIGVPVLLVQGGKDQIVNPQAQKAFCRNMNAAGKAKCTGADRQRTARFFGPFDTAAAARARALTVWLMRRTRPA
ncbi:MAG: alpha/beta fold hydrolase [Burkholderiaceae bacterium]|nr:alpha/beta fold hydrolase [Burkholderiaceae bacterium]